MSPFNKVRRFFHYSCHNGKVYSTRQIGKNEASVLYGDSLEDFVEILPGKPKMRRADAIVWVLEKADSGETLSIGGAKKPLDLLIIMDV